MGSFSRYSKGLVRRPLVTNRATAQPTRSISVTRPMPPACMSVMGTSPRSCAPPRTISTMGERMHSITPRAMRRELSSFTARKVLASSMPTVRTGLSEIGSDTTASSASSFNK